MDPSLTNTILLDEQIWGDIFKTDVRAAEDHDALLDAEMPMYTVHFPSPPLTPVEPRPQDPFFLSQPFSPTESVVSTADQTIVSVSTTFHPTADFFHSAPADIVLLSTDIVFFYAHESVLLAASSNNFGSFFPLPATSNFPIDHQSPQEPIQLLVVPESSAVLNVILHIAYGMSPGRHSPSFATLAAAIDRLPSYGILLYPLLDPTSCDPGTSPQPQDLHNLLLAHAHTHPLELYTLAASHDLRALARAASAYLLGQRVCDISDAAVERMGGVYLARLVRMQLARIATLKRAVVFPPSAHVPTKTCGDDDMARLTRAWGLVAASLVWDALPESSMVDVEGSFSALGAHLKCASCLQQLESHIDNVSKIWAEAPTTISF